MAAVEQKDPLVPLEDAGPYVGRDVRFMRELRARRAIEFVKVGGRVLVRKSVLDAYLAESTQPPAQLSDADREAIRRPRKPARRPRRSSGATA